MPETPANANASVSTDPPKVEKTEVDSVELETLKKSQGAMDELNTEAVELGFTDFNQYKQFLEEKKFNEINSDPPPAATPAPPATPTPPATQPVITPLPSNGADQKLNQASQLSAQSWMESQWTQFYVDQHQLPEGERSSVTKEELFKLVTGPAGKAIESLSHKKEYEGNLFAAADTYANIENYREKARKAGAESQAALNKAGETAALPGGVAPPQPPSGETPEQMNDKLADSICPDDPPIE